MKNKSLFKMPTNQDNVKGNSATFGVHHDTDGPHTQRDQHVKQPVTQKGASTDKLAEPNIESPGKVSGVQTGLSPESDQTQNLAASGKGGITSEPFAALYEEVHETDEANRSASGGFAENERSNTEVDQSNESKAIITASKQSLVTDSAENSSETGFKKTPTKSHGSKGFGGDVSGTGPTSTNSPLAKTKHNQNLPGASDVTNSRDVTGRRHYNENVAQKDETGSQKDVNKETTKTSSQLSSETSKGAMLNTKNEQKDRKPWDGGGGGSTALKTPTRGSNEGPGTPRQSKVVDHIQKLKRTPPAKSPRSPGETRISRALMERHQKTDEGNKFQKNATSKAAPFENPTESKTTDNKTTESKSARDPRPSKTNSVQPADIIKDTKATEKAGQNKTSVDSPVTIRTTDKPGSATTRLPPLTKPGSGDSVKKPANGTIRSEACAMTKDAEQKTNMKGEKAGENEQDSRAQGIFGRAVMRRLTSLDKAQPANNQSIDLNSSLNSSAGAKSLNSSTSSGLPHHPGRPAHKTLSMQSLAVPGTPGLGPTPMEADDKESVGSRRDSVRQSTDSGSRKSVDYRLQASQAVVAAGAAEEKPKSLMLHDDSMIRAAIPALPLPLAVLCLVLNILLPGSGTMVSGLSVLCCGKSRIPSKGDAIATTLCVNVFVGAAQLATVTFLLVGWFWSLAWGVKMVILAVEDREEQRQQREKELQTLALRAFGSPGNPLLRARSGNPLV